MESGLGFRSKAAPSPITHMRELSGSSPIATRNQIHSRDLFLSSLMPSFCRFNGKRRSRSREDGPDAPDCRTRRMLGWVDSSLVSRPQEGPRLMRPEAGHAGSGQPSDPPVCVRHLKHVIHAVIRAAVTGAFRAAGSILFNHKAAWANRQMIGQPINLLLCSLAG
jgi:hypothetical protein